MALRAFIYLRAYGLRLATVIYGVCTQVNGMRLSIMTFWA